VRTSSTGRS